MGPSVQIPSWLGTAAVGAGLLAGSIAVGCICLAWLLGASGDRIATLFCIYACGVLALSVYSGNSGVVSFGHASFMGLGAYVSGILTMPASIQKTALATLPSWMAGHELGLASGLAAALAVGLVTGALSGLPLSRLSGSAASIATLALLIIVHVVLIGTRDLTRGSQTFYGVPRFSSLAVCLGITIVFVFVARFWKETAAGLRLRSVREDEVAARSHGIRPARLLWAAWSLSIGMAAMTGALYGHFLGAFSPKDFYFDLTFLIVAMLVVGGVQTVTGAVLGAALVTAVVQSLRTLESGFDLGWVNFPGLFGLPQLGIGLALLLTIWRRPLGLSGSREWGPLVHKRSIAPRPITEIGSRPGGSLVAMGLSKSFGGLRAVRDVGFEVRPGEVVGLIGPNGAGKTTIVNLLTSQYAPDSGEARIGDRQVTGLPPSEVALAGLGRTFQAIRLFRRLTCFDNVLAAAMSTGAARAEAEALAARLLETFGLAAQANVRADALPYGGQRKLEIARVLALRPKYVLLDEPAAGMNPKETAELVATLRDVRDRFGVGILIIEHDLHLIMSFCDRVVVVNKGEKIAEGSPGEIRGNPLVIEAYLGSRYQARDQLQKKGEKT